MKVMRRMGEPPLGMALAARTTILRERRDCIRISPAPPTVRRFTQADFFVVPVRYCDRRRVAAVWKLLISANHMPDGEERNWPVTDVSGRSAFPAPTPQGAPGAQIASWGFLRARGRLASLRPPRVLALERLKFVHLSRSSFLHSGASMCV